MDGDAERADRIAVAGDGDEAVDEIRRLRAGGGSGSQRSRLGGGAASSNGALRIRPSSMRRKARCIGRRPDAVEPGAAVLGARRGEGRAAELLGIKPERRLLRRVLALAAARPAPPRSRTRCRSRRDSEARSYAPPRGKRHLASFRRRGQQADRGSAVPQVARHRLGQRDRAGIEAAREEDATAREHLADQRMAHDVALGEADDGDARQRLRAGVRCRRGPRGLRADRSGRDRRSPPWSNASRAASAAS